jgi:hypothetical protein
MSDLALQKNEEYLANALAWLCLLLEARVPPRAASPAQPPAPPVVSPSAEPLVTRHPMAAAPPAPGSGFFGFWQKPPSAVAQMPVPLIPAPSVAEPLTGAEASVAQRAQAISQLRDALDAAITSDPPPLLVLLAQELGLSAFERDLLLLCAAPELNTKIGPLCGAAQGDPTRPYPTFALAMGLFDEPRWDVLSAHRPLRYWRLIEINQTGTQPLSTSALRADERIVHFIKGFNALDDRLNPLLNSLPPLAANDLPPSQQASFETIIRGLKPAGNDPRLPVIQLLGADNASKQQVAAAVAQRFNLDLLRWPAELLSGSAAEVEALARLWQRESILLPLALYLDASELANSSSEGQNSALARFLARIGGFIFLDTREPQAALGREFISVDIHRPTALEQREAWAAGLGPLAGTAPSELASQFNLDLLALRRIARVAASASGGDSKMLRQEAWQTALLHSRPQLASLAQRIDVRASWDDLVLPLSEITLLKQIAAQVGQRGIVYEDWGFGRKMNRGKGISALFCGESGTGKTMAAEVIARALKLDLYRIDLSQVINKYIGETEKNLRRLFDAAEAGGVILFFDEADALFGKRSEVKDSHDRYANIEINYLLQRMEAYSGLAILATNLKSALDTAFTRRLRFIVNFAFPGPAERKQIWQRAFPQANAAKKLGGVPLGAIDYDHLARLSLAGGSIHNIALNAAFLAAEAQSPVTMELILAAARSEFRKIERPINEADFRWAATGSNGRVSV